MRIPLHPVHRGLSLAFAVLLLTQTALTPAYATNRAAAPRRLTNLPAPPTLKRGAPAPVRSATAPVPRIVPQSQPATASLKQASSAIPTPLDIAFEENRGQSDQSVRYRARSQGATIFFTPSVIAFALPTQVVTTTAQASPGRTTLAGDRNGQTVSREKHPHRDYVVTGLHVRYEQAAGSPSIVPGERLPGTTQYFLGSRADQWRTNVPTYRGIRYQNLYRGIDLQYDGTGGVLESTYVVRPGSDPTQITWRYQGARALSIDNTGNLVITVSVRPPNGWRATQPLTVTERAPVAWQERAGQRVPVEVRYTLKPGDRVSFNIGTYDPRLPLIIDPEYIFSSPFGGLGGDVPEGVAVDSARNTYIVGSTYASDFPTVNPIQSSLATLDAFVAKLPADGSGFAWSTYLGGSSSEEGYAIAVDSSGASYVTGYTASTNFPVTTGAYRTTRVGLEDIFVAKINAAGTAIQYGTYLGSTNSERGYGIAVDSSGAAYVTGSTYGSLPATTGAYRTTPYGGSDAYVAKFNAAGSALSYLTYLGGSGSDGAEAIVVNSSGYAAVTGRTWSSSFPLSNAVQSTLVGGSDAFVTQLNATGTGLIQSTYLGGTWGDQGLDIAETASGALVIVGETETTGFPVTTGVVQGTFGGGFSDAFVATIAPGGGTLEFASYLGGSSYDQAKGVSVGPDGKISVTGYTGSSDFPTHSPLQSALNGSFDAFVTQLAPDGKSILFSTYLGGGDSDTGHDIAVDSRRAITVVGDTYDPANFPSYHLSLPNSPNPYGYNDGFVTRIFPEVLPYAASYTGGDCGCANRPTGNPINTRSGAYWTSVTDLAVERNGPAIVWQRFYVSPLITTTASAISPGWQHPYAARVILPAVSGGDVQTLSGDGNIYTFSDLGGGQYRPLPGAHRTLVQANGVFTETLRTQAQNIYDATTGRLLRTIDPLDRTVTLSYSGSPARLDRVEDANDATRYLALTYNGSGSIDSVSDGTRTVTYTYDGNGDLHVVDDVAGRPTTYTYQSHLLTEIENALGQSVEQMVYDSYTASGKVIQQTLQDGQQLDLQYLSATTIITTTGTDGHQDVELVDYSSSNTLAGVTLNGESLVASGFEESFNPGVVVDGNNNQSRHFYTEQGLPELSINALGQRSRILYDSENHPVSATNPLGVTSLWRYDSLGNVISTTVGLTTTNPLGLTTLYTYTYDLRYTGDSLIEEQRAPDGVRMRYAYDVQGQVISTTLGYGTALAQTTGYEYDTLGRLITTTLALGTALERRDVTRYNTDNTVDVTIQNYVDGVFSSAAPDEDVATHYGYDDLGRQIWVQNALGQYDVTRYNAAGQVEATARNISSLTLDGSGQPIIPAFSPSQPDQNVATAYAYDGLGRTTLVTETGILTGTFDPVTLTFSASTTRTTLTEYDSLSRPVTVTLNYQPGLPVGTLPDVNVQTVTYYDGAGNVIWQRDALGRWTKTEYDVLNRPIRTIRNYEDGDPLTGAADADIVAETHYDVGGRVAQQIENAVDGVFTATEPITDRITLTQYDGINRPITTTLQYDPPTLGTRNDTNRVSLSAYEVATGRMLGQRDALGRWMSQQYDLLGRVSATIQNCTDGSGNPKSDGCASFNPTYPDRNVVRESHYDALGRVNEAIDPLGVVVHITFDGLGRTTAQIQNYILGGPTTAITNVTTLTSYDVLGRAVSTTDPELNTTQRVYDGLGHTIVVTDPMGLVTRSGYDGSGTVRWVQRPDGQLTIFMIDGLGRTTTTIANFQDGVVDGGDPDDRDVTTTTVYDAAGRRTVLVDPDGRVTQYAYDNLDHLTTVTENAVTGGCPANPCNVVTQYIYDRLGNRLAIIDANGHTRRFAYNAASETVTATDALNQVTGYAYDLGGRLISTDDPRGSTNDLSYAYDGLDRQTSVTATNLGTITQAYDAAGRRTSLTDVTGTTTMAFDPLGRVTQVDAPSTGTVGYGYDARGLRTQLSYPSGLTLDYTYFPDGHLDAVRESGNLLAYYSYDAAGRLDQVNRANGVTTLNIYDGVDRVRELITTHTGNPLRHDTYVTNRAGLRTQVTETVISGTSGGPDVIDDFDHPWVGAISSYALDTQALAVNGDGAVWWDESFGGDQEAFVTLPSIVTSGDEIDLLLKSQGTSGCDMIEVLYHPATTTAEVWTCDGTNGWVQHGSGISLTLTAGDVFGARAETDGTVTIYQNGSSVGSETVSSSWPYLANDGRIGFWMVNVTGMSLDSFGGGTVSGGSFPATSVLDTFNRADGPLGGRWLWSGTDYTLQSGTLVAGTGGVLWWDESFGVDQEASVTLTTINASADEIDLLLKGQGTGDCDLLEAFYQPSRGSVQIATCDGTNGWVQHGSDITVSFAAGDVFGVRAESSGNVTVFKNGVSVGSVTVSSSWPYRASSGRIGLWLVNASGTALDLMHAGAAGSGSGSSTTRAIDYTYDALHRLTGAIESGATTNSYTTTYDLAGNRLELWVNGVQTQNLSYNAADQVSGWTYDAVGNLLSDGTSSYSYDALGRAMTIASGVVTSTNAYNGDGTLVAQTVLTTTTRYTQDLVSPLSQILGDGQAEYVYGLGTERLFGLAGSTRTWYLGDALGSVRHTLSDAGTINASLNYDPWGNLQNGAISPFGFTGELQQGGNVFLRTRWYNSGYGTFTSFRWRADESFDEVPYSHHSYAYALGNPISLIDPTGRYACDYKGVRSVSNKWIEYAEYCKAGRQRLDSRFGFVDGQASKVNAGFAGLLELFTDPDLPGGSSAKSLALHKGYMSPVAERLEYIMWYLGQGTGFTHVDFDDQGFAEDLRDSRYQPQLPFSNQVNHFLQAVSLGYNFGLLGVKVSAACIVGHEKYGQGADSTIKEIDRLRQILEQCGTGVNDNEIRGLMKAIDYDMAQDYEARDCVLNDLLPSLTPEQKANGQSVEDLRLSVKGWIFGYKIQSGKILTLQTAISWLRINLGQAVTRGPR